MPVIMTMKMKKAKMSFEDLRPNAVIKCFSCLQDKPQQDSVKFRAHHVCASCAQKLMAKDNVTKKD